MSEPTRAVAVPGQSRGKNAPRSESTRRRLMAAALQTFADKGFHGATTRDISRVAQVSTAGLYVYFESKEELLYLLTVEGHKLVLNAIRNAAATTTEPAKQLRAVVRAFAEHHARRAVSARVVNYEIPALSVEHRAEVDVYRRMIRAELRRILSAGVANGVFSAVDQSLTCMALLSVGMDIARWYRDGGEWTPEQIGAYYGELALRMVGHSAESPSGNLTSILPEEKAQCSIRS